MQVTIYYKGETHLLKINPGEKAVRILSELDVKSNTVLLTRNNEIILEDVELADKDIIKVLPTISGG